MEKSQQDEIHGPVAQAQAVLHRRNHAGPDRQAQDQGQQEAVAELPDLGLGRTGRALLPGGAFHFVARLLNHRGEGLQIGGLGIIAHLGLAGGQVDQGQFHPRGGGQGPFHPGDASGAVQPSQGEGDFFGFFRHGEGLLSSECFGPWRDRSALSRCFLFKQRSNNNTKKEIGK